MLGGLLALLSAATFGFNAVCVRRGVLTGSVTQAISITVPIGIPITLIVVLATGNVDTVLGLHMEPALWLMSAGVVHFCWGRYFSYLAMNAIGANLVAPVQQFALVLALGLAVGFLDEVITPLKALGLAMVLVGPMIVLRGRENNKPRPAKEGAEGPSDLPAFEPRYFEGYLYAFLSTFGQGASPILVTLGLRGMTTGEGPAGTFVSYCAATAVVLLVLMLPGKLKHTLSMPRGSIKWFVLSGLFVGISQTVRYMALTIAPVTVVAPIQRLSTVFRVLFGWFINPQHEVFGLWVIVGILVSLLGAVALSISTDFVIGLVPIPPEVIEIIRWEWP